MPPAEKNMFFFLCDISGYTNFMLSTSRTVNHAMVIITNLLEAIIKEVSLPMVISKVEGDALFIYLLEEKIPKKMQDNPLLIGKNLNTFFVAFSRKMQELQESRLCDCGACKNIESLNLKVICHFGKALIHKIGHFEELSGLDVIVAHRLLKNSLAEKRYLLLTESAFKRVLLPATQSISKKEETYPDVGTIPIYVYHPEPYVPEKIYEKRWNQFKNYFPIHLSPLFLKLKGKRKNDFNNL